MVPSSIRGPPFKRRRHTVRKRSTVLVPIPSSVNGTCNRHPGGHQPCLVPLLPLRLLLRQSMHPFPLPGVRSLVPDRSIRERHPWCPHPIPHLKVQLTPPLLLFHPTTHMHQQVVRAHHSHFAALSAVNTPILRVCHPGIPASGTLHPRKRYIHSNSLTRTVHNPL